MPKVRKEVNKMRTENRRMMLKEAMELRPRQMVLKRTKGPKDSLRKRRKEKSYQSGIPTRTWILSQ